VILSDAGNHASMIEGIRHSGARSASSGTTTWKISTACLADRRPGVPKLVAFESVYSMDGDIAPIDEICDVAEKPRRDDLSRRGPRVGLYGPAAAASPSATA
jgi:5-aminolevulinate synthase